MADQGLTGAVASFRDYDWHFSYWTSGLEPDGRPTNILRDFYIPVLQRAVRYDRVAGYFRSSSLAAASQGFSAFAGHQGRVRLVVGADLEPADVTAILKGTEALLSQRLEDRLTGEAWPEGIQQGVELLAWMVARGFLDLRVAFRVHAQTREPLPFDSAADGYVHMKFAQLTDAEGNRIYFSGSLNESRTALTLNAENIDVFCDWRNDECRYRNARAAAHFETLWNDASPALRVLPLPEAVKRRLMAIGERVTQLVEIDGSRVRPPVSPPSPLERLRFAILRDAPRMPNGRYLGMSTAPVEPWPHQAVVARRLIEHFPHSYLLCDEVGLGKTIEAGLALRSLILSGLAKRVLIAAPASLTQQWQREMAAKFLLPFARASSGFPARHTRLLPYEAETSTSSLYAPELVIVSTGLLARDDRAGELRAASPWDVVLVDEAHAARRKDPTQGARAAPTFGKLYRTLREQLKPRTKCLLLATATPMQLDAVEALDLLQLTDRAGSFLEDPGITLQFYDILGRFSTGRDFTEDEAQFIRQAVLEIQALDPPLWGYLEQTVIDSTARRDIQHWLAEGKMPRGRDRTGLIRLIFAAAPLSRVMLRHTRALLERYRANGNLKANLAHREILPLEALQFTEQEQRCYDALEDYCQALARRLADHQKTARGRGAMGFYLSFLRLRFASSLYAIRATLERRLKRVEATLAHAQEVGAEPRREEEAELSEETEDDSEAVESLLRDRTEADLHWESRRLRALLEDLADLSARPSKMQVLLKALEAQRQKRAEPGRLQPTVIFTRFYDTLTDIVKRLQQVDPTLLLATYSGQGGQYYDPLSGQRVGVERDEIKHRFLRGEIDVLVCTDAAAEGLNLQTADLLINFDLPWNPMKVEQRIGRIDRIGQRHERIYVLNLCYVGSAEEIVYGRLLRRLQQAGLIVGTQQLSLLPVTPQEFGELAGRGVKESTVRRIEQQARERAEAAQHRHQSMTIPPPDLYACYRSLERQAAEIHLPATLNDIWTVLFSSLYLRELGVRAVEGEDRVLLVEGIPELPDKPALTVSRHLFEAGLPALEGCLHFASYGDPVFDTLLAHVNGFELPPCVHRLAVPVPGSDTERVAYAAASRAGEVRLLQRLADTEGLELDENRILSEAELAPLRRQLEAQVEADFTTLAAAQRLADQNRRAAIAQRAYTLLAMKAMIEAKLKVSGNTHCSFTKEIAVWEQLAADPKLRQVARLPLEPLSKLSPKLLEMELPHTGDRVQCTISRPFILAGIDAAWREANAIHKKKSELEIGEVLKRLGNEIGRCLETMPSETRRKGVPVG